MSAFVITRRDVAELETEVFAAGPDSADEAVAVFCDRDNALAYLSAAGWHDSHTVAEIASSDLPLWLCGLHRDGVQFLAVDPNRREQEGDLSQPMLNVRSLLRELGEIVTERLLAPAPPAAPGDLQEVTVYHCQSCGRIARREPDEPEPVCCDVPMAKAATDTVRETIAAKAR